MKQHPKEAAAQLAGLWKIEPAIVETAITRRSYLVGAVTRDGLSEQQKIADVFLAEGLMPKRVETSEAAIWRPAKADNEQASGRP